ncbi:MAG: DNA cytosine methyltransferase [Rickettsiales bacterium]|nr:DNA cytosine methyltransferase [Rickettsiales bacterium]
MKMNLISNFSGAGLLDAGLIDAGNKVLCQCEIDDKALEVLRRTFSSIPKHTNILTLSKAVYQSHDIDTKKCAFVGGCPCQQHSNANPNKKFMPQSQLLYKLVDLCDECNPVYLLVENVEGFTTDHNGLIWLSDNMEKIGYRGNIIMFPAQILGAPHKRLRMFALFTRDTVVPANKEQSAYIENFKDQRVSMKVTRGIWHRRFINNIGINPLEIIKNKERKSFIDALKMIGNAVVYDVALFIGKSIKMFHDYFYDSDEGQELKKVRHSSNSPIDLGYYWRYMCIASLIDIATKLNYKVTYDERLINDKFTLSELTCSSDKNLVNYETPLASNGTIKSSKYRKVYRELKPNDKESSMFVSPCFNAWLMGMTARPDLLKNVWEVSGIPLSDLSKII